LRIAAYTAGGKISSHAPIVGPIIHKVNDEFDAVFFCGPDDGIESLETIRACVDGGSGSGKGLKVYRAGTRDGLYVIETPYSEDLLA
jgi:hypothetical protein